MFILRFACIYPKIMYAKKRNSKPKKIDHLTICPVCRKISASFNCEYCWNHIPSSTTSHDGRQQSQSRPRQQIPALRECLTSCQTSLFLNNFNGEMSSVPQLHVDSTVVAFYNPTLSATDELCFKIVPEIERDQVKLSQVFGTFR